MSCNLHQQLQHYFNFSHFRPGQQQIINSILKRQDTLAVLPTGAGKSICYQLPGLMLDGTTLVISPLISLMQDQVQTLLERRISACLINSSLNQLQITKRLGKIAAGKYKFVYLAPERLTNPDLISACKSTKISQLVIDEAHCASLWGHDFRPKYQIINRFTEQLSLRPIVTAFTATATPRVVTDIKRILAMKQPQQFIYSFSRDNLYLEVMQAKGITQKLVRLFSLLQKHHDQPTIIYCATRDLSKSLSNLINRLNFSHRLTSSLANCYHAGLKSKQRSKIQSQFLSDQANIICATNAFGMGVDKPNIRLIVHFNLPSSLENYYQEVGRAGRDGQPANCHLLFYPADINIQKGLLSSKLDKQFAHYHQRQLQLKTQRLEKMIVFAQTQTCLNQQILAYFQEKSQPCQDRCSICLSQSNKKGGELKQALKHFGRNLLLSQQHQAPDPTRPNFTARELMRVLHPQTTRDLLNIGGIGQGMIKSISQTKLNDL